MAVEVPGCALADRERLILSYLQDHLSAEEADAFESHCMTCDECAEEIQRGVQIRAAAGVTSTAGATLHATAAKTRRWSSDWRWLAAAASVVLVASVTVWIQTAKDAQPAGLSPAIPPASSVAPPVNSPAPSPPPATIASPSRPQPSTRAPGSSPVFRQPAARGFQPKATREADGAIRIVWPSVGGAARYTVTVYAINGVQLLTRQSAGPPIIIDAETAVFAGHADERLLARIDAVDALGQHVADATFEIPARKAGW